MFLKNGVELKTVDNDRRLERMDAGNLYIRNVTYDQDDGVYRCSVSNKYGESYDEKNVRVPGVYSYFLLQWNLFELDTICVVKISVRLMKRCLL